MKGITLAQVEEAVGGKFAGNAWYKNILIRGVGTDSRQDLNGMLFVPIKGANHDGHRFIADACKNGAVACLSEEDATAADVPVIRVESTSKALKDLAMYYKDTLSVKVVAVTGSVGKTTTKDMIASVLSQRYNTLKTEGNFNNEIGVPLTLFRLDNSHEYAVIEMGMNHFGEISELSRVVKPDICVITNIGVSHIENLESRKGILKAKSEIFEYMKPDGMVILNGDDEMLQRLSQRFPRALFYGFDSWNGVRAAELEANGIESTTFTLCVGGEQLRVTVPYPGPHMVGNALAAAAVGHAAGMAPDEIGKGIETVQLTKMRADIRVTQSGVTVLNDAYNSSPQSVKAALDILDRAKGRKVCVLGDMFELGEHAPALHEEVGRDTARRGLDVIIFVGKNSWYSCEAAKECGAAALYYESKETLYESLSEFIRPGDTVLVKASRGMAFEEVVDKLFEVS